MFYFGNKFVKFLTKCPHSTANLPFSLKIISCYYQKQNLNKLLVLKISHPLELKVKNMKKLLIFEYKI